MTGCMTGSMAAAHHHHQMSQMVGGHHFSMPPPPPPPHPSSLQAARHQGLVGQTFAQIPGLGGCSPPPSAGPSPLSQHHQAAGMGLQNGGGLQLSHSPTGGGSMYSPSSSSMSGLGGAGGPYCIIPPPSSCESPMSGQSQQQQQQQQQHQQHQQQEQQQQQHYGLGMQDMVDDGWRGSSIATLRRKALEHTVTMTGMTAYR